MKTTITTRITSTTHPEFGAWEFEANPSDTAEQIANQSQWKHVYMSLDYPEYEISSSVQILRSRFSSKEYRIIDYQTISQLWQDYTVDWPDGVVNINAKYQVQSFQKIICLTDNLKFSTLLEYHQGAETVDSLKQKLSQFIGLSCTHLSLKKKDKQEYMELSEPNLPIPLRDVYAQFKGAVQIQQLPPHIQFFQGENSVLPSMPREADEAKHRHTFSIPEAKDIEKIENQNGEFFTHTKEQIERKVRMAEAKHLFKPCALTGGIAYFCLESLTYCVSSNASNKTIASILLGTLGSTIISGVLAVGAHYMLDVYSKSSTQDPAHER